MFLPQSASSALVEDVADDWSANRLVKRENDIFKTDCQCTQRLEARRQALHSSLDRVLVIDARFPWNGVGNSLVRWLTLLRVGLASGRATFLWLSDFPESGREQHFDLGAYFVSVGADWQWTGANELRVRNAMRRQHVTEPTLVRYRCLRHTWACMRPSFEVGEQTRGEGFLAEFDEERDGALIAWLAARPEPWLQLSLKEQTALEQSGMAAGAVLTGLWARPIRNRLGAQLAQIGGAAAAERLAPRAVARAGYCGDASDRAGRFGWRPSGSNWSQIPSALWWALPRRGHGSWWRQGAQAALLRTPERRLEAGRGLGRPPRADCTRRGRAT